MKKLSFLFALLCASVMAFATVYDETELVLDAGETSNQTITLSICKSGANTTQVVAKSTTSVFTGVYECIWQQYGGGTTPEIGEYTVTDHEISFETTWDTYPTSATQLRFVARRSQAQGGSDIFGGTATNAEITGECAGSGEVCTDAVAPTISAVAASEVTHNSAVLTITAADNEGGSGISRYIVKNGETQLKNSSSNTITLTGLTSNTEYNLNVYVQDECENLSSAFAVSFTTENFTYCDYPTGHLANPNFGDPNGRILLTIRKISDSSVGVTVKPNNGGADVFDLVQVELNGVAKVLGEVGGSTPTNTEIEYTGLASLSFPINILWHHSQWADTGGRWTTQQFNVAESELCTESPTTAIDNVNADVKARKVVENGQLIIERDGVRYNVAGQIVK